MIESNNEKKTFNSVRFYTAGEKSSEYKDFVVKNLKTDTY